MFKKLLILSLFTLVSSFSFAYSTKPFEVDSITDRVQEVFDALKTVPQNYKVFGTICEEVARLRIQEEYADSDMDVLTGIIYKNGHRVLGELDVVVFNRSDKEAVLVAEVKCWRNLNKALSKAKRQLRRFTNAVRTHQIKKMYLCDDSRICFRPGQFDEYPEMRTVSQDFGEQAGFDMTLGLSLEEVKTLRMMLIRCQKRGECPTRH